MLVLFESPFSDFRSAFFWPSFFFSPCLYICQTWQEKKEKPQFIIITPSHLRPHLLPPLSLYFLSPPPLYPLGPFTLPLPCHHPSLHTFSPPSPSLPPSEHISLLPPCQQRMGGVKLLLISGWPLPLGHILRGSTWLLTWPSAIKTCVFSARKAWNRGRGQCVLMLGWMCVWQQSDRRQTGSLTTVEVHPSPERTLQCCSPTKEMGSFHSPHAQTPLSYRACWLIWKGEALKLTMLKLPSLLRFSKELFLCLRQELLGAISPEPTHARKAHAEAFDTISTGLKKIGEKRQPGDVS